MAPVAASEIAPLLLPDTGLTVSHDASSVMPQDVFEVIPNVPVLPLADPIETFDGLTDRVKEAPPWVTVTVLLETPVPATVTVALRLVVPVLALVAASEISPSLLPATGLTVSHDASSVIPQYVFDVIPNVPVLPLADPIETLDGATDRVAVTAAFIMQISKLVVAGGVVLPEELYSYTLI